MMFTLLNPVVNPFLTLPDPLAHSLLGFQVTNHTLVFFRLYCSPFGALASELIVKVP